MNRFYTILKDGIYENNDGKKRERTNSISTAQAFAKAQREILDELRNEYDEEFNHPYFWAPFMLIGDWR